MSTPNVDDFLAPPQTGTGPDADAEIQPRVSTPVGFEPRKLDENQSYIDNQPQVPGPAGRLSQHDLMNPEIRGEEPNETINGINVVTGKVSQADVDSDLVADSLQVKFGTPGVYLYNQKTGAVFNFEPAMATHPDAVVIGGATVQRLNQRKDMQVVIKGRKHTRGLFPEPVINQDIERYSDGNGVIRPVQEALERLRSGFFITPDAGSAANQSPGASDAFNGFSVVLE